MDGGSAISIVMPDRVRIASPLDIDAIYTICTDAASENAMAPFNESKVRDTIKYAVYRQHGHVAGIIDGDNELAAIVILCLGQWWYSNEWMCEEKVAFVHPKYRRGSKNKGHARALLQFSKWWAAQLAMPLLMGVLSDTRTAGKVELYKRELPYTGALFLWRPPIPVDLNG